MCTAAQNSQPDQKEAALVLFIVACVQFLTPLMASSVGIALPDISREFHASATELSIVQLSFIFALAILILPIGRFADIHGRKRIFIWGVGLATLTTMAMGFIHSIEALIFFRFLQGAAAAMTNSSSLAILTTIFPPERRGRAMGVVAGAAYFGLAAGPTLGGVVTTNVGWRWLFYLLVPIQILVFVLTLLRLKGEWADAKGEKFGWSHSGVYIVSLSLLILGATQLHSNKLYWLVGLLGCCGFLIFYKMQAKSSNALIDVGLLQENRTFTLSNVATFINYGASFGLMFHFILYLQFVKGLSAQQAGFVMMVTPCFQTFFSPISGRWADRYPAQKVATSGMTICAVGILGTLLLTKTTSYPVIIAIMTLLGIGFGIFASPNSKVVMGCVEPRHYGTAASVLSTMRTGGILSSSVINTAIISLFMGDAPITSQNYPQYLLSMHSCMIVFALMSIVGIGMSLYTDKRAWLDQTA